MIQIKMNLSPEYKITVERDSLSRAKEILGIKGRALIVTDSGVPKKYSDAISASVGDAKTVTIPEGEASKSLKYFEYILEQMLDMGLTRYDSVIAVGGGVCGDIAGFAAASYMRGIAFYNVPTTLLSQLDSSIGGKTGINLLSTKNIIGAFHQPKGVLIDPDTLKTLPERQIKAGVAEAIKMALTSDAELFSDFENGKFNLDNIEELITRAVAIKKDVVEKDEHENGLRRVLNFGHTLGHGIESSSFGRLLHGECVALGILPMCSENLRKRVVSVYEKYGISANADYDLEASFSYIKNDKKAKSGAVKAIFVDTPGEFYEKELSFEEFRKHITENTRT